MHSVPALNRDVTRGHRCLVDTDQSSESEVVVEEITEDDTFSEPPAISSCSLTV